MYPTPFLVTFVCDWLCPLPTAASRSHYGAQPGFVTFSPAVSPSTHPPPNLPPTSLCLRTASHDQAPPLLQTTTSMPEIILSPLRYCPAFTRLGLKKVSEDSPNTRANFCNRAFGFSLKLIFYFFSSSE